MDRRSAASVIQPPTLFPFFPLANAWASGLMAALTIAPDKRMLGLAGGLRPAVKQFSFALLIFFTH